MGVGAARSVFAHVAACGCAKTVCMWSVCEWRGRCVGLTDLWAGHTAGGCVFTRQSRAVLWLVPLPRTPDLGSPSLGSDDRARLLLSGFSGLGTHHLLFAHSWSVLGVSSEVWGVLGPCLFGGSGWGHCLPVCALIYPLVWLPFW